MRTFKLYRRNPPPEYVKQGTANPTDQVQLEGVRWSDGTVSVRWLTQYRSFSNWESFEEFLQVHGHPEYESEIVWYDNVLASKPSV